jgi:LAO/AO transport system kinase
VPPSVAELLARYREDGQTFALSRALSIIESAPTRAPEMSPTPGDNVVHRIGITGPGGAGKSTLVGRLIEAYRASGRRVAVLAIDPSSPVTGGSVLGDRVRMDRIMDEGVFIRSLATRRAPGAVAVAAGAMLRAIESTGRFDVILVETAGAGQTDVAIAGLVDTVVLVTVPGLGDAVQAIKAGILELADIAVVNMADRPGANESARQLRSMLGGRVTVQTTVAADGRGVAELVATLDATWAALQASGSLAVRRQAQARNQLHVTASAFLDECIAGMTVDGPLSETVGALLEEAARRWRT